MRVLLSTILSIVLFSQFTTVSTAQILDADFKTSFSAGDYIFDMSAQSDGRLIVAGVIADLGTGDRLARINTNGSRDSLGFNKVIALNGEIGAVTVLPDDKILVGGLFTKFNNITVNNIFRLNSDGTFDPTFNSGKGITGGNSYVEKILVDHASNKIYVAGKINEYNGVETNLVVRLNYDGTLDPTFNVPTTIYGDVYDMGLQSDGKLIIAGAVVKDSKYVLLRLNTDGSIDNTFTVSSASVFNIFSIAIQPDDKIIAGGDFTNYNGMGRKFLVRLQRDGLVDNTFNPAITAGQSGVGPYYSLRHIKMQGEKIIITGNFSGTGTTLVNGLARLNSDGSIDNAFQACKNGGNGVALVHLQNDGKIVLAGSFVNIFEQTIHASKLVRMNAQFNDPPEAIPGFDFIISGNSVGFIDSSKHVTKYEWNFGDGKTSTVSNPTHIYSNTGNYNVKLDVFGHCNKKTSVTKQLSILGLQKIFPVSGGNTGKVTLTASGFGFTSNSVFRLMNGGTTLTGTAVTVSAAGMQLTATFDLSGKNIGDWDVSVSNNTGFKTLSKAFKVVTGIAPDIRVDIVGLDRIRRNTFQKFTVNVTNRGNVDAHSIPVFVIIEGDSNAAIKTNFVFVKPEESALYDEIPPYAKFDSLNGIPSQGFIYPILIPRIPASSVRSLVFEINTSNDLTLFTWSGPSYSPAGVLPGRVASEEDVVNCTKTVLDLTMLLLFGDADISNKVNRCMSSIGTGGLDVYLNAMNPEYDAIDKVGSISWSIVKVLFGCQDVIAALPIFRGIKITSKALRLGKDILEGAAFIDTALDRWDGLSACSNLMFRKESTGLKSIRAVNSLDPNEKTGPVSNPENTFIKGDTKSLYQIYFENISTATAPAQTVTIIDTLDVTSLDLSTFHLQSFGFGDKLRNVPAGLSSYTTTIDLRPANNLIVRADAKLEQSTGILTWRFISLDPVTLEITGDPLAGFLPPNVTVGEGQGFISYTILPKQNLSSGDKISNRAYIYFDNNEPIITNTYTNFIDKTKPTSKVNLLAARTTDEEFVVSWGGSDKHAGIRSFDIYIAINDEPFQLWLYDVTATSATFKGEQETNYSFYAIAKDHTSNQENAKTSAEASTMLVTNTIQNETKRKAQIYPNPMNREGTIEFELSKPQRLQIVLNDIFGRRIRIVKDEEFGAGAHKIPMESGALSNGIYFFQLTSVEINEVLKVALEPNQD